jgi:hypothetical protein
MSARLPWWFFPLALGIGLTGLFATAWAWWPAPSRFYSFL